MYTQIFVDMRSKYRDISTYVPLRYLFIKGWHDDPLQTKYGVLTSYMLYHCDEPMMGSGFCTMLKNAFG